MNVSAHEHPAAPPAALWARRAWVGDGWAERVLLRIGADGRWSEVSAGVGEPPPDTERIDGDLLPGLVDAHSHAFQRVFVGMAERREGGGRNDDFWSWRERMYRVANRIAPSQLRAVAAHLYLELLRGGYTHVCEFHYLQHDVDGRPYADPNVLAWALADAAADVGIGLTIVPVVYERAGFAASSLRDEQRRFARSVEDVVAQASAIAQRAGRSGADAAGSRARARSRAPLVRAGLGIHSLRAARAESIRALRQLADTVDGPIHIHVAEQRAEVDDCLAATGARPIEWLAREGVLDARWQLVHATHTVPAEIDAVARSGAGVVVCPSTEANLGDGLCDLPGWLAAGVPLSIGSDSHVTREWREELRWLEYGQRLARGRRNVAADDGRSTADTLFGRMVAGCAAAAGEPSWGLVTGARADALVVDPADPAVRAAAPAQTLDSLVFSSPTRPCSDVMVGGRWQVRAGRHAEADRLEKAFVDALADVR